MKRSREAEEGISSYDERDIAIVPVPKIANIDANGAGIETTVTTFQCSLPGHVQGLSFTKYSDYEKHYNQAHTNRCIECRKNFPSSHIVNLHIQEHHDALTEIRREKGDFIVSTSCATPRRPCDVKGLKWSQYVCFVEGCGDKFKSQGKRQDHLIKTHLYPTNYFFAVTKFGIDRRQSMLVEYRKKGAVQSKAHGSMEKNLKDSSEKSAAAGRQGEEDVGVSKDVSMREAVDSAEKKQEKTTSDIVMEDLADAMSSLKFIPRTVRLRPKKSGLTPG